MSELHELSNAKDECNPFEGHVVWKSKDWSLGWWQISQEWQCPEEEIAQNSILKAVLDKLEETLDNLDSKALDHLD